MKTILLFIILSYSFGLFGQTEMKTQDTLLYDKGEEYYFKNKLRKARKFYSKSININPKFIYAYVGRSITYSDRGKYKKAKKDLNIALSIDSADVYTINAFGLLERRRGNYDLAINHFNKAILLDSTYDGAYTNRGALNLDLKKYTFAETDILNAIRLNTDTSTEDDLLNLGYLYFEINQYQKSLDALNKCIALNPNYREAYRQRAIIYESLNDFAKASPDKKMVRKLKKKKNYILIN